MASAQDQEGYDDNRFQSAAPHNLHCAICLNVLKQPMQCVRNEHSFCKPCIHRHLQQTQKCPSCVEPLTIRTLRPSRLAADLLSELMIKCDNAIRGCGQFVKLGMLESHLANCEFSPVPCSNDGCNVIINRKDQQNHGTDECRFRLVKCRLCGELVNYWQRKCHCYATKKEIDDVKRSLKEIKDEVSDIKRLVMNLSQKQTSGSGGYNRGLGHWGCDQPETGQPDSGWGTASADRYAATSTDWGAKTTEWESVPDLGAPSGGYNSGCDQPETSQPDSGWGTASADRYAATITDWETETIEWGSVPPDWRAPSGGYNSGCDQPETAATSSDWATPGEQRLLNGNGKCSKKKRRRRKVKNKKIYIKSSS